MRRRACNWAASPTSSPPIAYAPAMRLDHLVLWVEDPLRACDFYTTVVGLTPVRLDEFREKKSIYVSVRISDDTMIDLLSANVRR